jgi:FkbM family methyltransferase
MSLQNSRHHFLQWLFWNPVGMRVVSKLMRYELLFDTVVRGYSLMTETNGERWLSTLMDEEPVVFDVGFHDGTSTEEILKVRPMARITAFDPSRFALSSYQLKFANDNRVTFANVALSSVPGELEFYDYQNMCNSLAARKEMLGEIPTVYKVPVVTLDAYCHENGVGRINFMKIDAEGYDLNVLEGGRELLARQRVDIFMFEFASGWAATNRYLWEATEFFEPLPYRLFHLYNGFLCPLVYGIRIDSCCTLPAMYVGISKNRFERGDIPVRDYRS